MKESRSNDRVATRHRHGRRLDGEAGVDVVFLSHTPPGGPFVVGSHHLSANLAHISSEMRATHISTPISPVHLPRSVGSEQVRSRLRSALGRTSPRPTVRDLTPIGVLPQSLLATHGPVANGLNAPQVRAFMRRLRHSKNVVLLVDQPLLQGHCDALPQAIVVYRPTDIPSTRYEEAAERLLVARSSGVVAANSFVLGRLRTLYGLRVPELLLENGVDLSHFRSPTQRKQPRTGVLYVGALDSRVDWQVLTRMAEAFAKTRFDIVGAGSQIPSTLPTNVTVHGFVPYEALPALMGRRSVGLLPFTFSERNRGRSPMKLFEYLAAGLRVVGPDLGALSKHAGRPSVFTYADQNDAVATLATALADVSPRRRSIPTGFDWKDRTSELCSFIVDLLEDRSCGRPS